MEYSAEILKTFEVAKVFKDYKKRINSISYDSAGEVCVTASDDESIHLYDSLTGTWGTIHYKFVFFHD